MPEIHIPLTHGQHEGIDAKVLPNGWLTQAQNVRFRKDGRLGSRYGYAFNTGTGSLNPIMAANFGPKRSIYITPRSGGTLPARWLDRRDDGVYTASIPGTSLGELVVPRRIQVGKNLKYMCASCDLAVGSTFIYAFFADYDPTTTSYNGIGALLIEQKSARIVSSQSIPFGVNVRNVKVVVVGSTVMVFYANTSNNGIYVTTYTLDDANFNTVITFSSVVTAAAGRGFSFDVAPLDSSTCLLAYESSGVNLKWGTVTTGGVFTSKVDTVIANPARPSIALGSAGNVVLVWGEGATFQTGNAKYRVDSTAGASVVATTTLDSSGLVSGFPVAGPSTGDDYTLAWNRSDNKMGVFYNGGAVRNIGFLSAVSKPFACPNGLTGMWTVNYSDPSLTTGLASYKLIDTHDNTNLGPICEAVACQHAALPGARYLGSDTNFDNRRNSVATTTLLSSPSATATATLLPIVTSKGQAADIVRIDSGPYADRLLPARIDGQLLFSGPRMRVFDGSQFYEVGMGDGAELLTVADAGAGSIAAGTFQYVVVYEWADARGRRHRSPPSLPQTITIGANRNVNVTYSIPAFSDRFGVANTQSSIVANVYRTAAGGIVFYLVNSSQNLTIGTLDGATRTYTDSATDASIIVNEALYTQGARGGLSGLLPNDEPPPCRFIWPGNNRVIMGGLEDPSGVQWSKLVFPGEPIQFSIDPGFKGRVDGEVTAVASLDGIWYVFTRDSIWAFSGEGPDDTGANGDFGSPRKLPSDIGCISHRSIVEVQEGLLFQGRSDRIYLLPRGGNAPQWIAQQVRDTLTSFPFITAAKLLPDENLVAFACINNSALDGRLLIYDTRIREWTVDVLYGNAAQLSAVTNTLDVYDGKLQLGNSTGVAGETSAYMDDENGINNRAIVGTLVTGDIRPFGLQGWGRTRSATVQGEYRSATTYTLEVSMDSGQSYATAVSYTPSNSAGDQVETAYDIPVVKNDRYRFRIISTPTTPSEGWVFNALSLEVYQERGLPRLPAAYRH